MARKKYTIEDIRELAKSKNGKCVSDNYINAHTKLKWQCNICNNVWKATPNNIRQGRWCPECAKKITGDKNRKYSIQDMQKLAKERGGECLSKEYIDANTKLLWKCNICDHKWKATPSNIQQGKWCPKCMGKNKTIEDMRELAKSKNGKCLSKKYSGSKTKLKWQCEKMHTWYTPPSYIVHGNWCPYCAGKYKTIKDMQKMAEEKKGKCLSKKYINANTKLKWQCNICNNVWKAKPSNIQQGNWCPYCSNNISDGEQKFREAMEKLLNVKLPKKRPKWLVNEEGNRLELDGYNEKLKIAFEYQGQQHFEIVKIFKGNQKKLDKVQKHDNIKKELCKQRSITLLCPTYKLGKTKYDNFIKNKLKENNLAYLLNY